MGQLGNETGQLGSETGQLGNEMGQLGVSTPENAGVMQFLLFSAPGFSHWLVDG